MPYMHGAARVWERHVQIEFLQVRGIGLKGMGPLLARFFLEFTQKESCGRCPFCRIGTKRMLEILERICSGDGEDGDIDKLETLAVAIKKTSLCGLGQTAPNPVLSTLRFFRKEYESLLQPAPYGPHQDGKANDAATAATK